MLERLLTQETSFLRYPGLFSAFEQQCGAGAAGAQVLGQGCRVAHLERGLRQRRRAVLHRTEHLRGGGGSGTGRWPGIMATDISREALERAEPRGLQPSACWKILSPRQIATYFSRVADGYKVKPVLREMVKFAPMNLARAAVSGTLRLHLLHERTDLFQRGVALPTDSALLRISGAGRLSLSRPCRIRGQRPGEVQPEDHARSTAAAEAAATPPGTGRGEVQ